ncbi:MAG: isoprenylcysteine carboxylmethyltransferase family protein [Ignavibacteria bacterium]|jgi:protein-S-isoprenylcysteine O-methyltransferase Ste14
MISEITKGRIFTVIQFTLGFIIIVSSFFEYNSYKRTQIPVINIISIILIVACGVIMITAFTNFNQLITANPVPRDSAKLRTGGIYSVVRHPMYLGALLGLIGFSLYYTAYYTTLLNILISFFFVIKINFEEKQLLKKYPEYSSYQTKTKKLIPFLY